MKTKNSGSTTLSEQLERIKLITGRRTTTDLADFFGVPLSAVSAAVRRGKMPSSWLVILMRVKNVHPEWILTGKGPCLMTLRPGRDAMKQPAKRRDAAPMKKRSGGCRRVCWPRSWSGASPYRRSTLSVRSASATALSALPFIESDAPTKKGRQSPTGLFPINGTD